VFGLVSEAFKNTNKFHEACFSYEEGSTLEVQAGLYFNTAGITDTTPIHAEYYN
jgi:hypothetical protein